ncbi:MAG: divergent polysaccharide deacetylase family protein [Rhodospirillales bacterium]
MAGGLGGRTALTAAAAGAAVVALAFAGLSLLGPAGRSPPAAAVELPVMEPAAAPAGAPQAAAPQAGIDGGLVAAPYTAASFARLPELAAAPEALSPAPDPASMGPGTGSGVANSGGDPRPPWQVSARPFDRRDDRSRLVIIVLDIGLSRAASEAAIRRLPGAAVLAVDAYAAAPQEWIAAARRGGHEVVAAIPLQASDGSGTDAGPRALIAAADGADDSSRLRMDLARLRGTVGVLMSGGGAFTQGFERLEPVLRDLQRSGLLLVDGTVGEGAPLFRLGQRSGLPRARIDAVVDGDDAGSIDRQLAALAVTVRERFVAIGAIRPTPVGLERLRAFLDSLDTSRYVLAPVSAVVAGEAG